MALCAYHEDTEAVATCVVCKSEICGKCQEFGADGMCGMCLEMSNARKASADASRQARVAAAPAAQAAAGRPPVKAPSGAGGTPPARPSGKPGTGGLGKPAAAGARPGGPGSKPGGTVAKAPPAGSLPASKAGFCVEHDGQQATALCTNCRKKFCPYCLDLYDLCVTCRALPHCSRHESMVSAAKCESCNLEYCRLCLDNTPFCDRCRTLGMAKVAAAHSKPKAKTGDLATSAPRAPVTDQAEKPPRSPTGGLPAREGKAEAAARASRPKPGQPGYRPPAVVKKGVASKNSGLGTVFFGGGMLLLLAAAWLLTAGPRRVDDEVAVATVKQHMLLIRDAAVAIHDRTGQFPDSEEDLKAELKARGLAVDSLDPPLRLVVNGPAKQPLTISFNRMRDSFEVRALSPDGRPLAEAGRDLVYVAPTADLPSPSATGEEPGSGDTP